MRSTLSSLGLLFVLAALGCSGSTGPADAGDAAATDIASGDAAPDAPASGDAATCGRATCGSGEVCVHPCCGGAAPACLPPDDAGMCPAGSSFGPCFGPGGLNQGCSMQCTPPPPFCAPRPASGCTGGGACPLCPSGGGILSGSDVSCQCA